MVSSKTITLLLAAIPFATCTKKTSYLDKFDGISLTTIPTLQPVDASAGGALYYNAFGYFSPDVALLFQPASPPNVIEGGAALELKEGQRFWRPLNSSISSFDEKSISYACVAEGAAGPATKTITCTIQLVGKKYGTGDEVVLDLLYDPGVLGTKMNSTVFPSSFWGLTEVDVTLASSPVGDAGTLIVFDSHAYDAYSK